MPRNVATSIENNFVNGFVTEATALNFPEAASYDSQNCTYWLKGNVTRRYGFDFESNYWLTYINRTGVVVNSFLWQGAGGSGTNDFVVLQVGATLYFFKTNNTGALSSSVSSTTIDITQFKSSTSAPDPSLTACQFAYGYGWLFVTHPSLTPFYVAFDPVTANFSTGSITIYIRDTVGVVDETTANDQRPSSLTPLHNYNLWNQGWAPFSSGGVTDVRIQKVNATGSYDTAGFIQAPSPNYIGDPLQTWIGNRTDVPSNADVWWLYKDAMEQFQPKLASTMTRGNTVAPKGHFIMPAFNQDRNAVSQIFVSNGYTATGSFTGYGLSGLPVMTSNNVMPSTVAFFGGRVFYAGVNAQGYNNRVYFSQIVKTPAHFGLCYQQNDPTSETLFDLLATDGGDIQILDCGNVIKLVSVQSSLLIFASNGVWAITGSQGIGFTATDYTIRKISSIPAISPNNFVDVAGFPAWWNNDGVYMVTSANALGQVDIQSLTEKRIKTWFNDTTKIPNQNKLFAVGSYNQVTKVIQWCYRSQPITNTQQQYEFDSILCFNTMTQAFYLWSLPQGSPVTINGIQVTQGYNSLYGTQTAQVTRYIVSYPVAGNSYAFTFAEEYNKNFLDWVSFDNIGTDYSSYLVTGYKVHGDAQKKFQSNYLLIYANNTVQNDFVFQSIWDYATDASTGQFGNRQIVSWSDPRYSYRWKRLKVRGMGISLQFKFTSISGQPFDIAGWSAWETANTVP